MAREQGLIKLALFGSPVKHSLSPRIHTLFAEQGGIPVDYQAIESSEEFLSRDIQRLAEDGGRGCNITLPLKHCAFELCDRTSESARLASAVNTLLFESPSQWFGDNTDGTGLVRDLVANLGTGLKGRRVCILGAGGATAGVLHALLREAPADITVLNRDIDRAQRLVKRHADLGPIRYSSYEAAADSPAFDLVINATSAGHERALPPVSRNMFAPGACCYDLNYGHAHDVLENWCGDRNLPCYDGLGMLVEQAAESFRLWSGFAPKTLPVIERLRSHGTD